MKYIFILILIFSSFSAFSQELLIETKDSIRIYSRISAIGENVLHTPSGAFKFNEIRYVTFKESKDSDAKLYQGLSKAGVVVRFENFIMPAPVTKKLDSLSSGIFVDGLNLNELPISLLTIEAFEVWTKKGALSSRKPSDKTVKIKTDYGQIGGSNWYLCDSNGKELEFFGGIVQALNFLESQGWEYVDTYLRPTISTVPGIGEGGTDLRIYVLRRHK